MKFDEDKFDKCFDKAAKPWIFVPVLTREDARNMVKGYLDTMQTPTNPHLRECPACTNKEKKPGRHTCSLCGHKYYGEDARNVSHS